jgi:hypothetical protein
MTSDSQDSKSTSEGPVNEFGENITDRKKHDEALKTNPEKYRVPNMIFVTNE